MKKKILNGAIVSGRNIKLNLRGGRKNLELKLKVGISQMG